MAVIPGSPNDDDLPGGSGNDQMTGLAGDDRITGGKGNDTIFGGTGRDTLFGGGGSDRVVGDAGDDELVADGGDDTLDGGDGDDFIRSDDATPSSAFVANGGRGNDFFSLSEMVDGQISGGSTGYDTLRLSSFDATLTLVTDLAFAAGHSLLLSGINRFELSTGDGNDDITTGNTSDAIGVGAGSNTVSSGGGDDAVSYTAGQLNTIDGGEGEADELQASAGDGVALTFIVNGATATDGFGSVLKGFETYNVRGGTLADEITLGSGNDRSRGGAENDSVQGNDGRDVLRGGAGDDLLDGGAGADVLRGIYGDDTLMGGAGRDRLYSSPGSDLLTGGDGADRFVFASADTGRITISDFTSGVDRLQIKIDLLQFMDLTGPLDPSRLSPDEAVGSEAQFVLRYRAGADQTVLTWAPTGDQGDGDLAIGRFEGDVTLSAGDIFIF